MKYIPKQVAASKFHATLLKIPLILKLKINKFGVSG
jgi:hypothetical protein